MAQLGETGNKREVSRILEHVNVVSTKLDLHSLTHEASIYSSWSHHINIHIHICVCLKVHACIYVLCPTAYTCCDAIEYMRSCFNPLKDGDENICQWTGSSLVQVMACGFGSHVAVYLNESMSVLPESGGPYRTKIPFLSNTENFHKK